MVTALSGGKQLPAEVLEQILAKTDGVTLFVEELAKTVLEADFLRDAGDRYELVGQLPPLAIPSTLQDSLMARLDRLAPVKEVAQVAASIGREFSYELLAAVAPLSDIALRDALNQLADSDLIIAQGRAPVASYNFKHALIQEAAYASMLRSQRRTLHATIAHTMAQEQRWRVHREILAHHYTEARMTDQTVLFWQEAELVANARSAHIEAVEHLRQGLRMLASVPTNVARKRR